MRLNLLLAVRKPVFIVAYGFGYFFWHKGIATRFEVGYFFADPNFFDVKFPGIQKFSGLFVPYTNMYHPLQPFTLKMVVSKLEIIGSLHGYTKNAWCFLSTLISSPIAADWNPRVSSYTAYFKWMN